MAVTWSEVVAFGSTLPGVEESTWYRTPALKVAGKGFARLRDEYEGGLLLVCSLPDKEALLATGNAAFYTTPHYDGYGSIIVDLGAVSADELRELVEEAWRLKAPAKVRAQRAE